MTKQNNAITHLSHGRNNGKNKPLKVMQCVSTKKCALKAPQFSLLVQQTLKLIKKVFVMTLLQILTNLMLLPDFHCQSLTCDRELIKKKVLTSF
jgi:hypothetical protein